EDGRCDDRQGPYSHPGLARGFVPELAELLRGPSDASDSQGKIGIQFMSDQAPQAADLIDALDSEARLAAQFAQSVWCVTKVIVRFFMKTKRKRRGQNERAI